MNTIRQLIISSVKFILFLSIYGVGFQSHASGNADIVINASTTANGAWAYAAGVYTFTPSTSSSNILNTDITRLMLGTNAAVGDGLTGITNASTNGAGSVVILTACSGAGNPTGNVTTSTTVTAATTSTTQLSFTITATGSITLSSAYNFTPATNASTGYPGANVTLTGSTGVSMVSINCRGGASTGNAIGGNGGDMTLTATSGTVSASATLTTSGRDGGDADGATSHGGNGGDIAISGMSVSLFRINNAGGKSANAGVGNGNGGIGGTVSITATATLINSGEILNDGGDVSTTGGTGGNVGALTLLAATDITLTESVRSQGGIAGTSTGGNGAAITMTATAGAIAVTGTVNGKGGVSNSGTAGIGGNATFIAGTSITLSASMGVSSDGLASAGNVSLTANGGAISIFSLNTLGYPAGNITATASTGITVFDFVTATGTACASANGGAGGNVTLTANNGNVYLSSASAVFDNFGGAASTANYSGGVGGNIALNATGSVVVLPVLNTYAGASSGAGTANAGNVTLTGTLGVTLSGNVNTTSSSGVAGAFTTSSPATVVSTGLGANDGQITAKVISGGAFTKNGAGTFQLLGSNTYAGTTTVNNGVLRLGAAGVIPDASNVVLAGGTFNTGVVAGFSETAGTLSLTDHSTLALGTGGHSLVFSPSAGIPWTANKRLYITGWTGGFNGTSGTAGKIFTHTTTDLTGTQLSQIYFLNPSDAKYYTATQLVGTGEVVPTAVLPVHLLQFNVAIKQHVPHLNWRTAQEINNHHFDIERSHDGGFFEKIGEVKGAGTTSSMADYSYIDQTVNLLLPTYYRLKQVDDDGGFDYSTVRFLPGHESVTSVLMYPNPLEEGESLYVKFGAEDEGMVKVCLFDISGNLIHDFLMDNILPNGTYALEELNLGFKKGDYILQIHTLQNEYVQKLELK